MKTKDTGSQERLASFTPGPWRVEGEGIKAMVRGDDATIVCLRHRLPGVVNDANMRLIAAAPELLAACERFVSSVDADHTDYGFKLDVVKNARVMRAAIKKAKGEA